MTPAERAEARRDLYRVWGDRVEITTENGCLMVDVHHPDGGHTFAQISKPNSYMLCALTAEGRAS